MNSFTELWAVVSEVLRGEVSDIVYKVWLEDLEPVSFDGSTVTLSTVEFKRKIIEQKFSTVLHDAFEKALGFAVEVRLVNAESAAQASPSIEDVEKSFHEDNTFQTFVVGSSNKFAHAAAQAVAANPGGAYNPLFIYGRSGLGKTHLLNAIAHEIRQNNPKANVLFTQGEAFTNEIVRGIGIGQSAMTALHEKYRTADVLLVDDIQFIAGKPATEEEFFYTFNTLSQAGNQIVLTSDRPPKDIATLEDRLRTRFEMGLIADIQPPDIETRMAIVKRKAETLDLKLSDDVVQYIADRIKNNVRQLEGAVKKIKAVVTIHGSTPNMATVQAAIKDILNESRPEKVTVERIIEETARTFNADPADLRSKKRDAQTSRMRMIAMDVISDLTGMSTKAIGQEFGGRDHSTVVHALREIKKQKEKDSSLRATIENIAKNVQESD
ncbi:MAG: chromosomal replication initiator protein DnaA [Clostridia bacterium]|nr:chromosomal replication initiator protein DnaA [Clostridia bacterium]